MIDIRGARQFVNGIAYAMAAHTELWCDPALADDLATLADPARGLALDDVQVILTSRGWQHVGRRRMLLLLTASGLTTATSGPLAGAAAGFVVRSVDANVAEDLSMLNAFAAGLCDEDREEADLDRGEFDDHIVAVMDERGIAALASQQPFDHADGFGYIAVATREDARGWGWGASSSPDCVTRSSSAT